MEESKNTDKSVEHTGQDDSNEDDSDASHIRNTEVHLGLDDKFGLQYGNVDKKKRGTIDQKPHGTGGNVRTGGDRAQIGNRKVTVHWVFHKESVGHFDQHGLEEVKGNEKLVVLENVEHNDDGVDATDGDGFYFGDIMDTVGPLQNGENHLVVIGKQGGELTLLTAKIRIHYGNLMEVFLFLDWIELSSVCAMVQWLRWFLFQKKVIIHVF